MSSKDLKVKLKSLKDSIEQKKIEMVNREAKKGNDSQNHKQLKKDIERKKIDVQKLTQEIEGLRSTVTEQQKTLLTPLQDQLKDMTEKKGNMEFKINSLRECLLPFQKNEEIFKKSREKEIDLQKTYSFMGSSIKGLRKNNYEIYSRRNNPYPINGKFEDKIAWIKGFGEFLANLNLYQ
jgi:chromosome segregation ATPase